MCGVCLGGGNRGELPCGWDWVLTGAWRDWVVTGAWLGDLAGAWRDWVSTRLSREPAGTGVTGTAASGLPGGGPPESSPAPHYGNTVAGYPVAGCRARAKTLRGRPITDHPRHKSEVVPPPVRVRGPSSMRRLWPPLPVVSPVAPGLRTSLGANIKLDFNPIPTVDHSSATGLLRNKFFPTTCCGP